MIKSLVRSRIEHSTCTVIRRIHSRLMFLIASVIKPLLDCKFPDSCVLLN